MKEELNLGYQQFINSITKKSLIQKGSKDQSIGEYNHKMFLDHLRIKSEILYMIES